MMLLNNNQKIKYLHSEVHNLISDISVPTAILQVYFQCSNSGQDPIKARYFIPYSIKVKTDVLKSTLIAKEFISQNENFSHYTLVFKFNVVMMLLARHR